MSWSWKCGDLRQQRLLLLTLLGIAVQLLLRFPLLACVVTQRHAQLGDKFRRFAQGLTLDHLVWLANRQLDRLHGRYLLLCCC
jgi:exonuclease SbcC